MNAGFDDRLLLKCKIEEDKTMDDFTCADKIYGFCKGLQEKNIYQMVYQMKQNKTEVYNIRRRVLKFQIFFISYLFSSFFNYSLLSLRFTSMNHFFLTSTCVVLHYV